MSRIARAPVWLWVAAATLVGVELVGVLTGSPTTLTVASFAIITLLAWFLLRGSRVVWLLAVGATAAELLLSLIVQEPLWLAGIAVVRLTCLLVPSSWAFVWSAQRHTATDPSAEAYDALSPQRDLPLRRPTLSLLAKLEEAVSVGEELVKENAYDNKVLGWLVVGVVTLMLGTGGLYALDEHIGHDSIAIDVLWSVLSAGYKLGLLALLALVALRAHRYVTTRSVRVRR